MSDKKKVAFDRSLQRLSDLVDKAGIRLKTESTTPSSPPRKDAVQASSIRPITPAVSDEAMFRNAMTGVHPASWRHTLHPSPPPVPIAPHDSEFEERRLMQTALEDESSVPVLDHPEYIEGWVGVAGRKFLPMLRNGLYSIQGQLDLHGINRIEAQIAVEDFIAGMARFRSCCIKIIHGRGMNSPTDKATLKEDLQRLLKTRRLSRYVVAYASAPACDGGVGAVYVLLRRQ
jgi:DNA-nicking Smr family endonuclease